MAYIGNIPAEKFTSVDIQNFTVSATANYTLDRPVANENEIELFINNVRQHPGSGKAYTASGTALTLSEATAGTDTMYCVYQGKARQTVTPATSSVTNDMLAGSIDLTSKVTGALPQANIADQAINEAKMQISNAPTNGYMLTAQSGNTGGLTWAPVDLTALSASNLTSGTIPDARFPATLPAVSGANLTGLPPSCTGGGSDEIFWENGQTVTTNYTITNNKNAMSAGPITINNGVSVTIGTGENWTIV